MGTESWGNSRQPRLPDYYGILGVEPNAPFQEIQAAYWCHANARDVDIALLNAAYEVLGEQSRRETYDTEREQHGVVPHRATPKQLSDDGPRLQGKLYGFLH
jgi:curved DNA-binding protein CbpA